MTDRRRTNARAKGKPDDQRLLPERVGIRSRYRQGDAEMAILENGHRWCLKAGDLERGVFVRHRAALLGGRLGRVVQLVPTWGDGVTVVVRWEKLPGDRGRPGPFWAREELQVVRREG